MQVKQDSDPEPLPHAFQYCTYRAMIRLVKGRYTVLHLLQCELPLPNFAIA
jgi:hypothetical protein